MAGLSKKQENLRGVFLNIILIGMGLFFSYYNNLFSGHLLLPGDYADGRLNHYFLEHSWSWAAGDKLHSSFWDAPFFYPMRNTMAYSILLLGAAPFYWILRLCGCGPEAAFLIWPAILGILNYLTMYVFLRKAFSLNNMACAAGAYLFAFNALRLHRLGHIQFWPQFYSIIFLLLVYIFCITYTKQRLKLFVIALFCAVSLALQFYTEFYLGWFLTFGIMVYFIMGLVFKRSRKYIKYIIREKYIYICMGIIGFGIIILPLLYHYLIAYLEVGDRSWEMVAQTIPDMKSFLTSGAFIYQGWMDRLRPYWYEHVIGIGVIVTLIGVYGLGVNYKKSQMVKLLAWSAIAIIFLTAFHVRSFYAWKLIYEIVPGAGAIRSVARVAFILIIIFSIGYALALRNKKLWLQIAGIGILCIENAMPGYFYCDEDKYKNEIEDIARLAQRHDLPFLYLSDSKERHYVKNLNAMWASLKAGKPTLNGYTGQDPENRFEAPNASFQDLKDLQFLKNIKEPILVIIKQGEEYSVHVIMDGRELS